LEITIWIKIAWTAVLLILSALFSSAESAFFSLSRGSLEKLGESVDPRAKRVARMMEDPRLLLTTILAGNTIVNTIIAVIAALIAFDIARIWEFNSTIVIIVEMIVISIVLLFMAEIMPKLLALKHPESWAVKSSGLVKFLSILLIPIAAPVSWFTIKLAKVIGVEQQGVLAMSESEIRSLVEVGHEHGELEPEERQMIHSIFEFGETAVREIMIPRIDIVVVESDIKLDELKKTIVEKGHSRLPVFSDTIDNIVGLIYAKDLLAIEVNNNNFAMDSVIRDAYFVPEEKKIDDLLHEFQVQKIHLAIVVDEYGGTAGIVTMEDVIEEIVGEIQDEYDSEQPLLKRIDENNVLADGRLGHSDFNEKLGFELIPESEAYDTLAGFIFSHLGVVPKNDHEFEYKGFKFIVEEVHGKRITRIRICKEGDVFQDV